jgi:hypothetical protein
MEVSVSDELNETEIGIVLGGLESKEAQKAIGSGARVIKTDGLGATLQGELATAVIVALSLGPAAISAVAAWALSRRAKHKKSAKLFLKKADGTVLSIESDELIERSSPPSGDSAKFLTELARRSGVSESDLGALLRDAK